MICNCTLAGTAACKSCSNNMMAISNAEFEPIKSGKWIPHREKSREYIGTVLISVEYDYWFCDICGYRIKNGQPMYNFCPNCGVKMEGTKRMTRDLTELNKLEEYLKANGMPYKRVDNEGVPSFGPEVYDHHQIIVYNEERERVWDAICHYGSYGVDEGLLEVMGNIVDEEIVGDNIEGYLTAEDVIRRIKEEMEKN